MTTLVHYKSTEFPWNLNSVQKLATHSKDSKLTTTQPLLLIFHPATDNAVSAMVKEEVAIDVPYGVDILWLRLRVMSVIPHFPLTYSTRRAFQPIYRILVAISKDK